MESHISTRDRDQQPEKLSALAVQKVLARKKKLKPLARALALLLETLSPTDLIPFPLSFYMTNTRRCALMCWWWGRAGLVMMW